ncbi:MAG TPA: hypothetical protein VHE78_14435 [Gemmatimonadaceae bacterium]|nr:hypothetical protein [Gemmatimonadaceae bacterium]
MSSSDWDAQMKRIDRQLASIPDESLAPARVPGAPAPRAPGPLAPPTGTTTVGVFARLGLALALGVAIVFWPYSARCGLGLAGYLGAVTMLITAGVWSAVWTWRHRAPKGHILALLLVLWGLALASADALPRVGWAKASVEHPARWTCG